jgi:hypothetical protein
MEEPSGDAESCDEKVRLATIYGAARANSPRLLRNFNRKLVYRRGRSTKGLTELQMKPVGSQSKHGSRLKTLPHEFVEFIPDVIDEGKVYVSIDYATAVQYWV